MSANRSLSFAVLGAGLVGRLIAWRLLAAGHKVDLFEKTAFSQPQSAANTAAAMISPLSEVVVSEPIIYHMGLQSLHLWPQWLDALKHIDSVYYRASGSLVLAHPQDFSELLQFKQDLQYKLGEDDPSQWLDGTALRDREPQLDNFVQGLFLPDEAYLDNRHLLEVLLKEIVRLGGKCHEECAGEWQDETLYLNGDVCQEPFDWILDCRGLGSKTVQRDLRGVRGEVMWVQTAELNFSHAIRLMHPRYKLYVVPKPGNRFIIGATEIESEDKSPISIQSSLELASALYTIHPAFAEARVIETDSNLRPAYRDNLPYVRTQGSYISINGLYRHGYLLAPTIVQELEQFLLQGKAGTFWEQLVQNDY